MNTTNRLHVILTAEQHEHLRDRAQAEGRSMGDTVRTMVDADRDKGDPVAALLSMVGRLCECHSVSTSGCL